MGIRNVAILGATSHIAKGLVYSYSNEKNVKLSLYARNTIKLKDFLQFISFSSDIHIFEISEFGNDWYDMVINCVGYGDPGKLQNSYLDFIKVTERYDNIIVEYIEKNPDCIYVNLSSGAAYGDVFSQPVTENTKAIYECNPIKMTSLYGIAKLYSEAKHRAMKKYKIIDVRVFGYFSRFIDLKTPYLLSDMINAIKNKTTFITDDTEIWRDYIGFEDLSDLILSFFQKKELNTSIDICSGKPVSKTELINFFSKKYQLEYKITKKISNSIIPTGFKKYYYSVPTETPFNQYKTSLMTVEKEAEQLLLVDNG